jgi:hypothetical protein
MFRGRHFDRSIILLCVRWYLAYGLSLRDLGLIVEHHDARVGPNAITKLKGRGRALLGSSIVTVKWPPSFLATRR